MIISTDEEKEVEEVEGEVAAIGCMLDLPQTLPPAGWYMAHAASRVGQCRSHYRVLVARAKQLCQMPVERGFRWVVGWVIGRVVDQEEA